MKHLVAAIFITFVLCLVAACDKAPRGVIGESTMEDLLVDIELADAYIESHYDQFPNDSSRLVLKQSIFAKYGITPEMYDTSLVWYSRNMDVYVDVYDRVIGRLQAMRDSKVGQIDGRVNAAVNTQRRSFASHGDSADLWHGPRRWILTHGMKSGFISFDVEPDKEYYQGDRYELMFLLKPVRSSFRTFMAVDYKDGGTALVSHFSQNDGWNSLVMQSDSTREVRRIYGYLYYNILQGDIAYVDSLTLLRTHCDRNNYSTAGGIKTFERIKKEPTALNDSIKLSNSTLTPHKTSNASSAVPTATPSQQPQGIYKPKEGVSRVPSGTSHSRPMPLTSQLANNRASTACKLPCFFLLLSGKKM